MMLHELSRVICTAMMSMLLVCSPALSYVACAEGGSSSSQGQTRISEEEEAYGRVVERARAEEREAAEQLAADEQAKAEEASARQSSEVDSTVTPVRVQRVQGTEQNNQQQSKVVPQNPENEEQLETEVVLAAQSEATSVEDIVNRMSLDEKISQMIIVSSRAWDDKNVTDLSVAPQVAEILKRHQYGGFILFGQNITSNEQVANLVQQLQENNRDAQGETYVPYFVAADEEGGIVTRLSNGTRMTGSMAIGATPNTTRNAEITGNIIGAELMALGINVNFAPSMDVNSNPANPSIGTRAFSDDPNEVSVIGNAWIAGHAPTGAIATLKHFPGHGDTDTDTHIGTAAVNKTKEELEACELVPFRSAVSSGADMIMTAHITLPKYDEEQQFADGSKGYFPATMSHKIITELLRGEMGYDGVVVTDALEMDAIDKMRGAMVGGGSDVEQCVNVAEKVINAGCDILLMPLDITKQNALDFYDTYIDAIANKVGDGEGKTISMDRIDESVTRILRLKEKYGFLQEPTPTGDISLVGSEEHHEEEMAIAKEAITLVKNDTYTLPVSGHNNNIVLIGRTQGDNIALDYAVQSLQDEGLIPQDAFVNNLAASQQRGDASSSTKITIDYTFDLGNKTTHYTDELQNAISEAKVVAAVAKTYALSALKEGEPQYEAIRGPLDDTHKSGGKFVFISDNLPYDVARYTEADAILLAYMGTGTDIDPTSRSDGSANVGAFNANLVAAIGAMFDSPSVVGKLPVEVPGIVEARGGELHYSSETLYERGFGLQYEYVFTEGGGGRHTKGASDSLTFKNNARFDKLTVVSVDGEAIAPPQYAAAVGSTIIELSSDYLNSLAAGDHTLAATYAYDEPLSTNKVVETQFSIDEKAQPNPKPEPEIEPAAHVKYLAHVQRYGWQTWQTDGSRAGTERESKRLEALMIQLVDAPYEGSIEYRAHVQRNGWQDYVADGVPCGTEGLSRRMEAFQIRLTGEMAEHYDVWYRAHVQTFGWLGWAKNDEPSGTAGYCKRMEAVEIKILPKGSDAPGSTDDPFRLPVTYRAHVQTVGWQDWVRGGVTSGTQGQSKRLEALRMQVTGSPYEGSIEYRVHVRKKGWLDYVSDGQIAGTVGESRRAEAVQIRLTGELGTKYDVWYRVHAQTIGWMGWAANDAPAGSEGLSKRLEAVQVVLVPKNGVAPGDTDNAYMKG